MGSAAESEIGSTYINTQEALTIQTYLIDMNNPQQPNPIKVDNSTAVGFSNKINK